ncbi:hypothetical protein [Solitalea koreensis]|uniref:BhlA holin family protein n=1 Tax=Solitalea koreensis TaxID=543615 RepID=A0A521BLX7_9SPHI|nr:hypothetical protein [Solitalea koreensis]SMO48092.1 hypothetical protein SAMN06265350_102326 [Solitalea koreensis]
MNRILLQITEVVPTGIVERLGDQFFSISILLVVAYLFWKQQGKLSEKMEKYIEEDRKQMLDVIEKNTKAFERLDDLIGSRLK